MTRRNKSPQRWGAARLAGPEPTDAERRRMLSPDPGLLASPHTTRPPPGQGVLGTSTPRPPQAPAAPWGCASRAPSWWHRARDARVVAALKCGSGHGGAGVRGGGGTALLGAPRAAGAAAAPPYPADIMRI